MKSFSNGNGNGVVGGSSTNSGPADSATPLITTGKPPGAEYHWWELV